MPQLVGSVSPSAAFAAIAASTALPPRRSVATPISVASGWLVATMPWRRHDDGARGEAVGSVHAPF